MCGMVKPSKSEADYMAEDDHRTLQRAEEIRADPKRFLGVRKHHRKMTRAMSRVGKSLTNKAQPFRASGRSSSRRA